MLTHILRIAILFVFLIPFLLNGQSHKDHGKNTKQEKTSPAKNSESPKEGEETILTSEKENLKADEKEKREVTESKDSESPKTTEKNAESQITNSTLSEKKEDREAANANQLHEHSGPSGIPAGLMFPQVHKSNDWMLDYMYMQMDMNQLYNGSNRINAGNSLFGIELNPTVGTIPANQLSTGSVHNHSGTNTNTTPPEPLPSYYIASLYPNSYRYMSMPVSMKMEMTMISLMKNINDKLSVMFMIPYMNYSMQSLSGNLEKSFMRTQGVGDIGASLAYKLIEKEAHTFQLQFGVTLPTGSIDEKNLMPLMGRVRSPYNMQLGTGTYNAIPGFNYTYQKGKITFGSMGQVTLRNGKNDNGYRFGNRYELSVWTSYRLLESLAPTIRITSLKWDNISGSDPSLDPTMDPQNDPNRQGGRRIDLLAGLNFYIPSLTEKVKAGLEFGKPVYQHLNGPQLGTNTLFHFRFQASF